MKCKMLSETRIFKEMKKKELNNHSLKLERNEVNLNKILESPDDRNGKLYNISVHWWETDSVYLHVPCFLFFFKSTCEHVLSPKAKVEKGP